MAEQMPDGTRWVRVSERGRWHVVAGVRPGGAYQTRCGRVFPVDEVVTLAIGRRPGPVCGKC